MYKLKTKIADIKAYLKALTVWHNEFTHQKADTRKFNELRVKNGLSVMPSIEEVLNAPYVFVLSTGRSGTALLSCILEQNKTFLVNHDPQPSLEYISSYFHRSSATVEEMTSALLAARFDRHFVGCFRRGKTYVETNNRISLFAPAIGKLLPNAKFIHVVRHPGDFVRSGMRRGYYDTGTNQYQRLNPANNPQWNAMTRLEKIAWEWNEINQQIEKFKSSTERPVYTVKSESLFGDSKEEAISELWRFLGFANPFDSVSGREKLDTIYRHPINSQQRGSFPRYSNWPDEDKARLAHITSQLASQYQYSL